MYQDDIKKLGIQLDEKQMLLLAELQKLGSKLSKRSLISKIIGNRRKINGLYIHGSVGRGKSMLAELFYKNTKVSKKVLIHYSEFMIDLHKMLHIARSKERKIDHVILVARQISKKYRLLIIDEFEITDVTDAMILLRLFPELYSRKVTIVTTSNSSPERLGNEGLGKEYFVQLGNIIRENNKIFNLDSAKDYRLGRLISIKQRFFYNSEGKLLEIFEELSNGDLRREKIEVFGREIICDKTYENAAFFDYKELCQTNLASADFSSIAERFTEVFLTNIPAKFSEDQKNEVRRFILLIDALYSKKILVFAEFLGDIDNLHETAKTLPAFARTLSRLQEMSSEGYGA